MLKRSLILFFLVMAVDAKEYYLESLKTQKINLASNPKITIEIQEDKIFGFNGCNRFFGNVDKNKISNLGSTMMMCPQEDMELERIVMDIFKNASLQLSDKKAFIRNSIGSMIFSAK